MTRRAASTNPGSPSAASSSAAGVARSAASAPDAMTAATSPFARGALAAADPTTPIAVLLRLASLHPEAVLQNPAFELAMVADPNLLRAASDKALAALVECAAADPVFLQRAGALAVRPASGRTVNGRTQSVPAVVMPHTVRTGAAGYPINWAGGGDPR